MTPKPLSLAHLIREPAVAAGDAQPPLLLLLHGVGSNEHDLFALAPFLDDRFCVISARAPVALGPGAWGWYPVTFTPQGPIGDEARAETSRQAIVRFIGEAVAAYELDPNRVFLMGFSQGAIMSLTVALTQPNVVAGIVAMSGRLLPGILERRADDDALAGLPILAVHGTRDVVLPVANGREINNALSAMPVALTYQEYDMAHEVSEQSLGAITAWLTTQLDARSPTS